MAISRSRFRSFASRIDAIEERLNPDLRIRVSVFPGETREDAKAWYFAQRPEHAGARRIDYLRIEEPRGGPAEALAAFQQSELRQVMEVIDGQSRELPVRGELSAYGDIS